MSLKVFVGSLAGTVILGVGVWIWTLYTVDPTQASIFEFILFFASLGIWIASLFCLILFVIRLFRSNNEFFFANVLVSLRQGMLGAIYIVVIGILQVLRLLSWVEVVLILFACVLFEMYFWAKRK